MLVSVLFCMSPVEATTVTNLYELFGSEATNANPASSAGEGAWYTYVEANFAYANVNASDKFLINDSTSPPAAGYANFTFASLPEATSNLDVSYYTAFYFEFIYNNSLKASAKSNHSGIKFMLKGATYTVCTVYVYGLNETVAANKDRIVITNYSGAVKVNHTCQDKYVYSVLYEPDYDANTLSVTLTNESSGSVMNTTSMTLMGEDNIEKFSAQNYPASRKVYIALDNMMLTKSVPTYTAYPSFLQYIVAIAIPAMIFLAIVVMAVTGNITTPEGFIALLVIILLAFVTVAMVLS